MEPSEMTAKVFYGILGTRGIRSVEVAAGATVMALASAIKKNEESNDPSIRSCTLELYMPEDPQAREARLCGDDEDAVCAFVEHARPPIPGFKKLSPLWSLTDAKCFGPGWTPRPNELHVLVEICEPSLNKRRRLDGIEWAVADRECPAEAVKTRTLQDRASGASREWVAVPDRFLRGWGFGSPGQRKDLILYKSSQLKDLWVMIQTCAIDNEAALYVVGPPGSGKTRAAYAFACSQLDREKWTVLWIHSRTAGSANMCYCVQFHDTQMSTAIVTGETIPQRIDSTVTTLQRPGRGVVVFYDGYDDSSDTSRAIQGKLHEWHSINPKHRRLICVSSMAVLRWYKPEKWKSTITPRSWPPVLSTGVWPNGFRSIVQFDLVSWTLEEYVHAIQNHRFFDSVKAALIEPSGELTVFGDEATQRVPVDTRSRLVMDKYDIVGGNARLMFAETTRSAKIILDTRMRSMNNLRAVLEHGSDWELRQALGLLWVSYYDNHSEIVSQYVARRVVEMYGVDVIETCRRLRRVNPALGAFKGWFFLSLACNGLVYSEDWIVGKWEPCVPRYFDPAAKMFNLYEGWNIPLPWTKAGYDAVHWSMCPTGDGGFEVSRLLFVLLMSTNEKKTRTYDPESFVFIADRLNSSKQRGPSDAGDKRSGRVGQIDLYFVVPAHDLREFKFPVDPVEFASSVRSKAATDMRAEVTCDIRIVGVPYGCGT